ncbi:MAG TPA: DinB family protein [Chitinophagales bacterium]|nr:DinB family protein [Chitinophagales bacterium]
MSQLFIGKPDYQNEPDYCAYFFELVPAIGLLDALQQSLEQTLTFISTLTPEQWQFAYQKNKWTIAQVVRHIIDCERVYTYRAFRFSRLDDTPLAAFDENRYIANIAPHFLEKETLLKEYEHVRNATISLFSNMTTEMLDFKGKSGAVNYTTRGLGYMTVGHNLHHITFIRNNYL